MESGEYCKDENGANGRTPRKTTKKSRHCLHNCPPDDTLARDSRPPLCSRGNIVAAHLADPDSIPGRASFPG